LHPGVLGVDAGLQRAALGALGGRAPDRGARPEVLGVERLGLSEFVRMSQRPCPFRGVRGDPQRQHGDMQLGHRIARRACGLEPDRERTTGVRQPSLPPNAVNGRHKPATLDDKRCLRDGLGLEAVAHSKPPSKRLLPLLVLSRTPPFTIATTPPSRTVRTFSLAPQRPHTDRSVPVSGYGLPRPRVADKRRYLPLAETERQMSWRRREQRMGGLERLLSRRDVALREKTLWRLLYETAARAGEALALDNVDLRHFEAGPLRLPG